MLNRTVAEQVYLNTTLSGYAAGLAGMFVDIMYITVLHYWLKYGIYTPGWITPAAPIFFSIKFITMYFSRMHVDCNMIYVNTYIQR